jgi:WD40 repeat protein
LVYSLHYLSDGRLFVSQHNYSLIIDPETGAELARTPAGCHGGDRIAISADNRMVAWPARDGTIRVWNSASNEEEFSFHGHPPYIGGLVFSRDSRHLISVGHDSVIRIWGLTSPLDSRILSRERVLGGLSYSSDGRRLAIAHLPSGSRSPETGRVRILDVESGRELLRLDALGSPRFGPRDRWLATNRADGSITLWDPESGRVLRKLVAEGHKSMRIAVSPDGTRLACGTADGNVLIWNPEHDDPPFVLSGHTGNITSLAFSPDGRLLASSDRTGKVKVWDSGWKEYIQRQLEHHVHAIAFSTDSRLLAIAGESSTINMWDVSTGEDRHKLHGHTDWVSGLAFSPDGSRLISGSADQTVKLWDVASGDEVLSLPGARVTVTNVAIDSAGRRIVAAEGVVRVWEIE